MDEDRVRAVAVRDGDGYLVAALLPTDYLNLGFTPAMVNLRLRGVDEILTLRSYRNAILMAVVKRGKDLLLVALDLVGWEIRELPTRKLREDDVTAEFVVDGPAPLLPVLVRYDKRSHRITDVVKTSRDETEGARTHGVEFETLNTMNPGAHGGVELTYGPTGAPPRSRSSVR